MILAEHRDILGRWLQDTLGRQWPVTILNRYVNLGMREVEKHILSLDPETFKCIYTAATVVPTTGTDNIYSYPVGTFAVHEIAYSSDGVSYVKLPRRSLPIIRDYQRRGVSEACFVPYDALHFILYPGAATVVTSGIRAIVAPTIGMTDDSDLFPAPLAFETLALLETKKLALEDVGEPTDSIQQKIDRIKVESPRFFLTATEPAFIVPSIDRGYDG